MRIDSETYKLYAVSLASYDPQYWAGTVTIEVDEGKRCKYTASELMEMWK